MVSLREQLEQQLAGVARLLLWACTLLSFLDSTVACEAVTR